MGVTMDFLMVVLLFLTLMLAPMITSLRIALSSAISDLLYRVCTNFVLRFTFTHPLRSESPKETTAFSLDGLDGLVVALLLVVMTTGVIFNIITILFLLGIWMIFIGFMALATTIVLYRAHQYSRQLALKILRIIRILKVITTFIEMYFFQLAITFHVHVESSFWILRIITILKEISTFLETLLTIPSFAFSIAIKILSTLRMIGILKEISIFSKTLWILPSSTLPIDIDYLWALGVIRILKGIPTLSKTLWILPSSTLPTFIRPISTLKIPREISPSTKNHIALPAIAFSLPITSVRGPPAIPERRSSLHRSAHSIAESLWSGITKIHPSRRPEKGHTLRSHTLENESSQESSSPNITSKNASAPHSDPVDIATLTLENGPSTDSTPVSIIAPTSESYPPPDSIPVNTESADGARVRFRRYGRKIKSTLASHFTIKRKRIASWETMSSSDWCKGKRGRAKAAAKKLLRKASKKVLTKKTSLANLLHIRKRETSSEGLSQTTRTLRRQPRFPSLNNEYFKDEHSTESTNKPVCFVEPVNFYNSWKAIHEQFESDSALKEWESLFWKIWRTLTPFQLRTVYEENYKKKTPLIEPDDGCPWFEWYCFCDILDRFIIGYSKMMIDENAKQLHKVKFRRQHRSSGNYLGVTGANPRTGRFDSSDTTLDTDMWSVVPAHIRKKLFARAELVRTQGEKFQEAHAFYQHCEAVEARLKAEAEAAAAAAEEEEEEEEEEGYESGETTIHHVVVDERGRRHRTSFQI